MNRSRSALLLVTSVASLLLGLGAPSFAQRPPDEWRERPRRWDGGPPRRGPGLPQGTGRLRNQARGMCLDVAGWNAQGNSNVLLWQCNGDPDQVWSFSRMSELDDEATHTCLDAAGYDGARGANVDIYRCENLDDQRWTVVPRGGGTFELHNMKRGLCLDVNGKAGNQGDNVMLWDCDGAPDQAWSWEPWTQEPPRPGFPPEQHPLPPPQQRPELPVPPPPRRSQEPRPMNDESFQSFLNAVNAEAFSANKLTVVSQAASGNYFLVRQVDQIVRAMSFSADKLRALELTAPRVLDGGNAFHLYDAFTFSGDKDHAREILRRNGM
jgi:Ricin-type beta-trefoil lectin domain/Domain of unknown function (DUF4476)